MFHKGQVELYIEGSMMKRKHDEIAKFAIIIIIIKLSCKLVLSLSMSQSLLKNVKILAIFLMQ